MLCLFVAQFPKRNGELTSCFFQVYRKIRLERQMYRITCNLIKKAGYIFDYD